MALLQQRAAAAGLPQVEAHTVDRYQGRDKRCIIVSLVRSNASGAAGGLLTDWQRLNVALTRARHKLLMVGSARTLAGVPLLGALLQLVAERGWLVALGGEVVSDGAARGGEAPAAQGPV